MSDSQQNPWSDDPNAPKIAYSLYFFEKVWFAGNSVTIVLYGIAIVLFFKCIAALFDPVHRRGEPIKWGLVSYVVVMFSLVTIGTAMQLNVQSISYIDNREFPGAEGLPMPGPAGYQEIIVQSKATDVFHNFVFALNIWLADGFLLYRCYVIYSMKIWVIAIPCIMFLGSLAMGAAFSFQTKHISYTLWAALPYFSISLSLNILLTLMIVIRLALHTRKTRNALGITGIGGLCKAIITMLVESCALYAVNSLLLIGTMGARNAIWNLSLTIIGEIQVIAPLLIVLRVANKSALTSNTLASGCISELRAQTQGELASSTGTPPGGDPASPADEHGTNSGELRVGVQTTGDIDFNRERI